MTIIKTNEKGFNNKVFPILNESKDLFDFIKTFNSVFIGEQFIGTERKPRNASFAFKNGQYFVTNCFIDDYKKITDKEELLKTLEIVVNLDCEYIIKLLYYDEEKDMIIWDDVSSYEKLCDDTVRFNLLNNPKIKKEHLPIIKYQLMNAVFFLTDNNLIHLDLETHNIGFSEIKGNIKIFDIFSIRTINKEKNHISLLERGEIKRVDTMNPPFIKFFDCYNQFTNPKTLIIGSLNYNTKPIFLKEYINDISFNLGLQFNADYAHYKNYSWITTIYKYIIIAITPDQRKEFLDNFQTIKNLEKIGENWIFYDTSKKHFYDLKIEA